MWKYQFWANPIGWKDYGSIPVS